MWPSGLRQVHRNFNIEEGLVQAVQELYENTSNAVVLNSQLREFFKTTVDVHLGCLLSLILFNLFRGKIIQQTLHDHHTSISTDGRLVCNLLFADNIDLMGSSNGELQDLTNRLADRAMAYVMEASKENSKIMINS